MNRKLALFGALIAVPSLAFGQVADAKVRDTSQSRSTSEFNSVDAGFADDVGSGQVGAYETANGTYVGYFQYDGGFVCNENDPENPDDDSYVDFQYWTQQGDGQEGGPEPTLAQTFTIGRRNSSAFVEGSVTVQYNINVPGDCAGEGESGETELFVTIDLTSNGVRIQNTDITRVSGPDFSNTDKWSFSGNGATGTVTVEGDFMGDAGPTDAEGQIGTNKSSSSQRSR